MQEEEKKRIARDLHDDTAQSLSMLSLEIDTLIGAREITVEKARNKLRGLRQKADRITQGVRRFSHELRPGVLDQLELIAALESLIDDINQKSNISASLQVIGHERRVMAEIELALFRLSQEALNNIRKHFQATKAIIRLRFLPGKVRLMVADNGKGFDLRQIRESIDSGKLGITGMKERAHMIGADLKIKSKIGLGTVVSLEVVVKK